MPEKPVIREFFMDDEGLNKTISYHYDKRVVLYLKLKAEGNKKRKVGVITKSTHTMQVKRNREKHLFIKTMSWGFNDYILRRTELFDKIWLVDNWGDEWVIPVPFILENGHYFYFLKQGFEKQVFIKLEEIEQFKVKKEEKRRF